MPRFRVHNNMKRLLITLVLFLLCVDSSIADIPRGVPGGRGSRQGGVVERERPQLNEETRRLISAYRQNPTPQNYAALKRQVEKNYDAVVARKKAKLEELRRTAKHEELVTEMQVIVDDMIRDRAHKVEQTMSRFTDSRLKPGARENKDGYLPIIGAKKAVSIGYTPVTNEEYGKFVKSTGRDNKHHTSTSETVNHPVVNVTYADAVAYCKWLSKQSGGTTYRLPTEEEWELAAGHMPKDADFNCGVTSSTLPVTSYSSTLSACGAIDMWGNCWEWTSDSRGKSKVVKGGSWKSSRTDCRTENRQSTRSKTGRFEDVGFRVVRED